MIKGAVKYNSADSTSDLQVFDLHASEGLIAQLIDARFILGGRKYTSLSLTSKKTKEVLTYSTEAPLLAEGDRVLLRYVSLAGAVSEKKFRHVRVEKGKDGVLFLSGAKRPEKDQITIPAKAYAVHEGVLGTKDAKGNLRLSSNTSLLASHLVDQVHMMTALGDAVAALHRKVRNSCIKVTLKELQKMRDLVIIPSCKKFNSEQGKGAKITYRKLADTSRDGELEYGHITQFYYRTLRGFIHHRPEGSSEPMYNATTTLSVFLAEWTAKIDRTIDYSAINQFDVEDAFRTERNRIAPEMYRTIFDKSVSTFNANLKQRKTKQLKAKTTGKALGFHQGWPKSSSRKKGKVYSDVEELQYFIGSSGGGDWAIPRRLSESGKCLRWNTLEGTTVGPVRLSPKIDCKLSGHPNMSSDSRKGQRELRKITYQYASGSPLIELAVLIDKPIKPEWQIAQAVLGHRKGKGLYINFVMNVENTDLKQAETDKVCALVPRYKRVGEQLEVVAGVDSDGSRVSLSLPLDSNWSELSAQMLQAADENNIAPKPGYIAPNPNSIRSRYKVEKDETYFKKNLSWKSIYASGVEENAQAAQADIDAIAKGILDLTLTSSTLLRNIKSLSWSEKISALRNAMIGAGEVYLTETQRKELDWELCGYRALKDIRYELKNSKDGVVTETTGVVPSSKEKMRESLPFIPELYTTLQLWEALSDRCYKYQSWGKEILEERQKQVYFLFAHRMLSIYGTVRLWNPDLEGMQKSKITEKSLDNSAKFRQWASLSTIKSAFLSASVQYGGTLEMYAPGNTEKGLKDLAAKGKIKLVTDMKDNLCCICGKEGTASQETLTCPANHQHDRFENRARLMLKKSFKKSATT